MIRAIFWDNDGLRVNTEHLYFRAVEGTLRNGYCDELTKRAFGIVRGEETLWTWR